MWKCAPSRVSSLLAALALSLTLACGVMDGVAPSNADMVGEWTAVDGSAYLHVSPEGFINYRRQRGAQHTELNLPAKQWADASFTVGALGMTTDFRIDAAPELIDGVWHLTVDGLEYTR